MRVEGTHEAIISRTDYELVQRLMLTDTGAPPGRARCIRWPAFLCCGDCLSTMARRTSRGEGKNAKRYIYYACIANRDNKDVCSSHSISEAKLEAAVLAGINVHVASVMQVREALAAIARRPLQKITAERLDRRLNTLRAELAKSMEVRDSLYRRYALGELSAEDFEAFKRIFTADCEQAESVPSKRSSGNWKRCSRAVTQTARGSHTSSSTGALRPWTAPPPCASSTAFFGL